MTGLRAIHMYTCASCFVGILHSVECTQSGDGELQTHFQFTVITVHILFMNNYVSEIQLYCSIGLHILFPVTIYILTLYDHLLLLPFTQTQAVVMPLETVLMVRYAKSLYACIAILSLNTHVCMSHSQF